MDPKIQVKYADTRSQLADMLTRGTSTRDDWDHLLPSVQHYGHRKISTAIRLLAAAAREWGPELRVITCSLDVKQAFDNVSSENLSLVMKDMKIAPVLAEAILREQAGGKCDICYFWDTLVAQCSRTLLFSCFGRELSAVSCQQTAVQHFSSECPDADSGRQWRNMEAKRRKNKSQKGDASVEKGAEDGAVTPARLRQ